jgi:leader peptidase (prepilin peptidase)/N-methyltransferase
MSLEVFVFIFGTLIGSFLNVVILRYNTGESMVQPGSRCFSCGKKLQGYELIPILSFIIQGGRCRNCKSRISWQYPMIEILTGLVFLLIFNFQFSILQLIYYWAVFSLLIVIAIYDLRHQIIPNGFVYAFDILAFLSLFENWKLKIENFDLASLLAGLIFFCFFASLWLFSKGQWMGFGDAKLSLGIGWLLGLLKGILAILLSFWLGAAVGIFLLFFLKDKYNIKSKISFGPFLVLGCLLAFFFGNAIIKLII